MNKIRPIYIIAANRTPIGRLYGALSTVRPDDLLAGLIKAMLEKHSAIVPDELDGLLVGCANQAGEDNRNVARMAVLLSGLPVQVYASTINSLCASGMDAVLQAARALALGEGELYLAGGVDSMSRSPWVESRIDGEKVDSTVGWRFINPRLSAAYQALSMPETAELLAMRWQISRQQQDEYAFLSRNRYEEARLANAFSEELIGVDWPDGKLLLTIDEQHRLLSLEALSRLPSVVSGGNSVTLGNSARIGDGAALLALASESYIKKHKIQPLARIHSFAVTAEHPDFMGLSPIAALQKALQVGGLQSEEIGLWEIAESFAVQLLACARALGLSLDILNPYGSAISMGNPLGMGGARVLVSLVHALQRNEKINYAAGAVGAGLGVGSALLLGRC